MFPPVADAVFFQAVTKSIPRFVVADIRGGELLQDVQGRLERFGPIGQLHGQLEDGRKVAGFPLAGPSSDGVHVHGDGDHIFPQRRLHGGERIGHVDGQRNALRVTAHVIAQRQKQVRLGNGDGQRMNVDAGQMIGAIFHQRLALASCLAQQPHRRKQKRPRTARRIKQGSSGGILGIAGRKAGLAQSQLRQPIGRVKFA